jgi:hypothetical protein
MICRHAIPASHQIQITFDYGTDGKIYGVTFGIEGPGKVLIVRLPARVENIHAILEKENHAAGSPTGGSGFLLSLCAKGYFQAAVSTFVLTEAARNIQKRMPVEAWANYQTLLFSVPFVIAPVPAPLPAVPPVNAKDLHIVAAADSGSRPAGRGEPGRAGFSNPYAR